MRGSTSLEINVVSFELGLPGLEALFSVKVEEIDKVEEQGGG